MEANGFAVQWRNSSGTYVGLSRYKTIKMAEDQIRVWMRLFPRNTYGVVMAVVLR